MRGFEVPPGPVGEDAFMPGNMIEVGTFSGSQRDGDGVALVDAEHAPGYWNGSPPAE